MANFYVSSTFEDLKEHREAVRVALHKIKQNVNAMEYYAASDERPMEVCLEDVAKCDVYSGIFAWRYGYVPKRPDPQNEKSITELEYREASKRSKRRLIFMVKKGGAWPTDLMDAVTGENERGTRIETLRKELCEQHGVAFFGDPKDLALQVGLAVFRELAIDQPRKFDLPDVLADAANVRQVGSSLMPEIETKIKAASANVETAKVISINLGAGNAWWSTRLHLLAALATDYTHIRQIAFIDRDGRFLGMTPPQSVASRLWVARPELRALYAPAPSMELAIMNFRQQLVSQSVGEAELKVWITKALLEEWLGEDLSKSGVTSTGPQSALFLYDILSSPNEFVPVLQPDGTLLGVADRSALAVQIAKSELQQHINHALRAAGQ